MVFPAALPHDITHHSFIHAVATPFYYVPAVLETTFYAFFCDLNPVIGFVIAPAPHVMFVPQGVICDVTVCFLMM
jgi:hypothetical protein